MKHKFKPRSMTHVSNQKPQTPSKPQTKTTHNRKTPPNTFETNQRRKTKTTKHTLNHQSTTHISTQKPQHIKYRRPRIAQGTNYRWRASLQSWTFRHHPAHQVSKSCCLASFGTVGSFGSSILPGITQCIKYRRRAISQILPCTT